MRRLHVVGLALLAILAAGAFSAISAAAHKNSKQIQTSVTVNFNEGEPGQDGGGGGGGEFFTKQFTNSSFTGVVTAAKNCHSGRTVTVQRVGGAGFPSAQTNDAGAYTVVASGPVIEGEQYSVTVAPKKIVLKNKGKHKHVVKCQPTTETITIGDAPGGGGGGGIGGGQGGL